MHKSVNKLLYKGILAVKIELVTECIFAMGIYHCLLLHFVCCHISFNANCKMKSTEVQTLGELCMRGTANCWAGLLVCVYSLVARGESDTG